MAGPMSALLTHALVGVLLGMAIRLPLRQLPFAAFFAIVPDLDHLDMLWAGSPVHSRTSFVNVFVCLALPLAFFAVLRGRRASEAWQRLALVAPLLMGSHLMLDMLTIDVPVDTGSVALFWPFTDAWFSFKDVRLERIHPAEYSSMTIVLALLTAFALATVLAHRALASPRAIVRRGALGAYAGAWLLLFPVLFATGFVVTAPRHVDAELTIEASNYHFPESRLVARIVHASGDAAPPGTLNLTLAFGGAVRLQLANPTTLGPGEPWIVDASLETSLERVASATLRLAANSTLDPFLYARANVTIIPAHVRANVTLASGPPNGTGVANVTILHAAGGSIPPRALRLLAQADGAALPFGNQTNPLRLNASESWSTQLRLPPGKGVNLTLVSVDDGFAYAAGRIEPASN